MTDSRSAAALYDEAVHTLAAAGSGLKEAEVARVVEAIATARRICLYGCGREGLQMRGFAMRLFHLGLAASVVGDMPTPAIGAGDLFVVCAGPGYLSTAMALLGQAKAGGARVLAITAEPEGAVPRAADDVLVIPAQTMASDRGAAQALLPMGSVFEGALFVLCEVIVFRLKQRLAISDEAMRANHTNME